MLMESILYVILEKWPDFIIIGLFTMIVVLIYKERRDVHQKIHEVDVRSNQVSKDVEKLSRQIHKWLTQNHKEHQDLYQRQEQFSMNLKITETTLLEKLTSVNQILDTLLHKVDNGIVSNSPNRTRSRRR